MANTTTKKRKEELDKQLNRWKVPVFKYVVVSLIILYVFLVFGANYRADEDIYAMINRLSVNFKGDLIHFGLEEGIKYPQNIFGALGIGLILCFLYIILDASKNHNYMRGKEFGTGGWGNFARINAKFADKKHNSWNRVYSQNLRISMHKKTGMNNNVFAIGGSGVGKSFKLLTPNIYNADSNEKFPGSLIFTDPKGELLLKNGAYLKNKGYRIKVLNLVSGAMQESDCFNPFEYIRSETDIDRLVRNIQDNTKKDGSSSSDPFWDNAAGMLLKSLMLLVWMEHDLFNWEMNFNTVMDLLAKAEVKEDEPSELDEIFEKLKLKTAEIQGKGEMHPAWVEYHRVMVGAADTKRSIIVTLNATVSIFSNPEIKRILSKDEFDLSSLGTGLVDGKKNVKTALFCIIPDSDKTFNAVAGMLYTLTFQELYFQADFKYGGELPVPVTFWMDEFANIALPKDFLTMLTTMRSRLISCVIIVQNIVQLEGLYDKKWEEVPGNCDVTIYLGGNEPKSFEYISKRLGKKTIYKKSNSESKGSHGSSSTNEDALGRELMQENEVGEMDNDYCIIFVRGKKPLFELKYDTINDPEYEKSKKLGKYVHSIEKKNDENTHIKLASQETLSEAFALGRVIEINLDQRLYRSPEFVELQDIIMQNNDEINEELERKKEIDLSNLSVAEILRYPGFELEDDEMIEVTEGIKDGLSDDEIKSYILFGDAKRMKSQRLLLSALRLRESSQEGDKNDIKRL